MTSQTPEAVEQPANHSPLELRPFGLGYGQLCTAPPVPTPVEEIVEALRGVELLQGLTDEEYLWLATHSSERVGPDQAIIFREGAPAHHFSVILKGEVCVYRKNSGLITLSIGRTGKVTGKLPFSRMKTWGGGGSTSGPAWILDVHEDLFPEMLLAIPSMGQRCASILVERTRDFTRAEQQAEKLDALGKLAANLSHELKNPASAAQRAALSLLSNIDRDEELCRLGRLFDSEEEFSLYREWICRAQRIVEAAAAAQRADGGALSDGDREDVLLRWLEAHRVPDAWKLAPVFAAAHLPVASLEELASQIGAKAFPAAVASFSTSLNARLTVKTIADSSSRIFSIIKAIQDYSYMDQAPVQDVDLIQSVESALTLLHSQSQGITIIRDFNPSMPKIMAYGGELSQVWTALIENAFAAMNGHGVLKITITLNGEVAFIEFWDDGPGIDPAISSRIFEPFFTTKPIGQALGLGLDTVRRIVHKHLGSVTVQSVSGSTCFQVRLPMNRPQVY
ncbi:signal transduction histidine kinase [Silvibacterium bohemicum]|uniref:histidine kinase n=1 Tax=Silvibacterium bohemicum TaxID=1577686 RepID=A0A841K0K6_9BACT|nr:ATP-binding protein [Silvibacterium bohemicum]MBB6147112.1 signal transduction histidine kinase [Silvibacterium bohemicum]